MHKQRWRKMRGLVGLLLTTLGFSVSAKPGDIDPTIYSYSRAYGVTERKRPSDKRLR